MSKIPTLKEIVQAVERLPLAKRKKAPQGRKPVFPDSFIIALAVYQKLASFRYAQKMPFGGCLIWRRCSRAVYLLRA